MIGIRDFSNSVGECNVISNNRTKGVINYNYAFIIKKELLHPIHSHTHLRSCSNSRFIFVTTGGPW